MAHLQIKNRWTGEIIHEGEAESLKLLVLSAVKAGKSLSDSDLSGSNLSGSNLSGSNLSDSDLSGSDLSGSDLSGSNLTPIRDDMWAVLSSAPAEVAGLREKIVAGEIEGSAYEGRCACLVGTIANVRGCTYNAIPGLSPNASRPIEKFFMGIAKGQNPENHEPSRLVLEWLDDWTARMQAAFGPKESVAQ